MQFLFQVNIELLYFVLLFLESLVHLLTLIAHIIDESLPLLLSEHSVFAQNVILQSQSFYMNLLSCVTRDANDRYKSWQTYTIEIFFPL